MANILIVDNEKALLVSLQEEFEKAGHNVKTALNGFEAIELLKKEEFDIVYTDLIMPKMNGVELCKEIKNTSNETQVVLMSGHPQELENLSNDFIQAGGRSEILSKPFKRSALSKNIKKILNK